MTYIFWIFRLLHKDSCMLPITPSSLHPLKRLFSFGTVDLDIPHFISSSTYFLLYYLVVLFHYSSVNLVNLANTIVLIFLSVLINPKFLFQLRIMMFGVLLKLSFLLDINDLSHLLMIFLTRLGFIYLKKRRCVRRFKFFIK